MKKTIGNYLAQPSRNFPLDAEGLDTIQKNTMMVAILGNICGDRKILSGCGGVGNTRAPGYIFLRTADFPEGEVIYFEGGTVSGSVYLKKENVRISAYGTDYPQAYTTRSLAPGVGVEQYTWSDFAPVATNAQLAALIAEHTLQISLLAPPPLGVVQMFAGTSPPTNYLLCEGQQLPVAEYPALYAAISAAYPAVGGQFRLPDLRGKFIVGFHPTDTEYNAVGKTGGEKAHTLTAAELPEHKHKLWMQYGGFRHGDGGTKYTPVGLIGYNSDNGSALTSMSRAGETEGGNDRAASLSLTPKGVAHENRPPYYTLAYIMRVK